MRISRRRHASPAIKALAEKWLSIWADGPLASKRDAHFEPLGELGSFQVRRSRNPYAWSLNHPQVGEVRIWNPEKWPSANRDKTGHVMIDFRSVFLLREGMRGVRRVIAQVVDLVYGAQLAPEDRGFDFDRVRRADLARDVQMPHGWEFHWAELSRFVSRSHYAEQWPQLVDLDDERRHAAELDALFRGPCPACGHVGADPFTWREPAAGVPPARWAHRTCVHPDTWGAPEDNKAPHTSHHTQTASGSGFAAPSGEAPSPDLWRVIGAGTIKTAYWSKFSAPLHARVYDKLGSLNVQNKGYMRRVWAANGWDGTSPVWRTEFCLTGQFLRGIVDPLSGEVVDARELDTFEALTGSLWAYLTTRWLRHTQPAGDRTHVGRWKASAWWTSIQAPWEGGFSYPARRLRVLDLPDSHALIQQALGCLATAGAVFSLDDGSAGAMERVASFVVQWCGSDEALDKQAEVREARGIDGREADRLVGPAFLVDRPPAWLYDGTPDGEPPPDFDPDDPSLAQLDRASMIDLWGGS